VGGGPHGDTFAFPDDINKQVNGFSIKLISNLRKPDQQPDGRFINSIETYYSFTCDTRLFRLNRVVPLTGQMGTGDVLAAVQPTGVWEKLKPGDTLHVLAEQLCK
jgi:hypothetical protein